MDKKKIYKQSTGTDVSKDALEACFMEEDMDGTRRALSSRVFKPTPKGMGEMHKWIEKQRVPGAQYQLVMEATGVYHEPLAHFLAKKGWPVSILLPSRSSAFAKSLGIKSRTDKVDARMLAQMALERKLQKWVPPSDIMLKIKRLCRERLALKDEKTAISNQAHARSHAYVPDAKSMKRYEKRMGLIDQQVGEVEKEIKKAVAQDPVLERKIAAVCSIPGVALVTAATIIAETDGFSMIGNKGQLVSYAGYDVVVKESGTSVKSEAKISKRGNAHIRKALYFPAITTVRHCEPMRETFQRIFAKSFVKMKGYVAIQRKLLVLIYTIYKSEEPFDKDYQSPKRPVKNLGGDEAPPKVD